MLDIRCIHHDAYLSHHDSTCACSHACQGHVPKGTSPDGGFRGSVLLYVLRGLATGRCLVHEMPEHERREHTIEGGHAVCALHQGKWDRCVREIGQIYSHEQRISDNQVIRQMRRYLLLPRLH